MAKLFGSVSTRKNMIITLRGTVTHKGVGFAIVEVAGVGYKVQLSSGTLAELPCGEEVRLWTHEHLRDDSRELFGFRNERERALFLKLLDVSGVGPKTALHTLSLGKIDEIERKIDEADADWLSRVPGVGKKTAQKIILELKGKLVSVGAADAASEELTHALVNLGYSREQAREAAAGSGDGSVEQRLKAALKAMAR